MIYFSSDEMASALPLDRAIGDVEQAFIDYGRGCIQPAGRLTVRLSSQGDSSLILPAIDTRRQYFGFKQAATVTGNAKRNLPTVLSQYFLYDLLTGEPLAIMDFLGMTNLKTGAAAAIATKYLARPDAKVVGVIGSGALAKSVLFAISRIRKVEKVIVFDLDPKQAEGFSRFMQEKLDIECGVAPTSQACTSGSDILCTCTTSQRPVLAGENLPPGCHVNAMGSYKIDMQELDEVTVNRAAKIITDIPEDTLKEAGDLISLKNRNNVVALDDIICGRSRGRQSRREITLYESIGFSVMDLALAISAYEDSEP